MLIMARDDLFSVLEGDRLIYGVVISRMDKMTRSGRFPISPGYLRRQVTQVIEQGSPRVFTI
jgi:hypothetical protein